MRSLPAGARLRFPAGLLLCLVAAGMVGCQELTGPLFIPGVTQIAFVSDGRISVIDPDGSNPTRITEGGEPAWSPDGQRLAFTCEFAICVIDADGSNRTIVTDGASPRYRDNEPAWSPDGRRIAFSRRSLNLRGEYAVIYVVNADGSDLTKLTSDSAEHRFPNWSPDGTTIVFTRTGRLHVMNPDGSNVAAVTADTVSDATQPAWSPDGHRIVFTWYGGQRPGEAHIWVINADGSGLVRLTNDELGDFHPTWSPGGTRIAFERVGFDREIYIMNADGSNPVNLTNSPTDDSHPAWAH